MTRSSRHAIRILVVLITSTAMTGCIASRTELCGDGVCRPNTSCRALEEPTQFICVTDLQVSACNGLSDDTECTFDSVAGTCVGGACFPARCGDSILDVHEECDDGGIEAGDGCSANCLSFEVCGDKLTDLSLGEQCDEGVIGLSGDGCSSTCLNEYDVWRDITPRVPLQRYDQAFVAEAGGTILMFGGTAGTGATNEDAFSLGDTWRWDGVIWSELAPPTGSPGRRTQMASAYDPARKRTLIFGGQDPSGDYLDELWAWNGRAWTKRTPTGATPPARAGASMACSPTRCLLFGGQNMSGALADTWSWDGTSWTPIPGSGPPARHGAALVYDTARSTFVMVGGANPPVDRQDYWEYSTSWAQMGTLPLSFAFTRIVGAFDQTAAAMIVINGSTTYTYNGAWMQTAVSFNPAKPRITTSSSAQGRAIALSSAQSAVSEWMGNTWSVKANNRPLGNPRGIVATYDPGRGRTIVVDSGSATWEWDGVIWTRTVPYTPGAHPPPAEGSGMVFDTKCGEAVLFGGAVSPSSFHGETWIYKGTWTKYAGAGPSPRGQHAMTYDANRDAVIVFGGRAPQAVGELWEWRGACGAKAWTPITTTAGPSARGGARMAYDERRKTSVLFGGSGNAAEEGWEWNGTSWTQLSMSATSPLARSEHGMAFDPRRKEVVVYGGRTGALRHQDGASWNGIEWSPIEAVVSVAGRSAMALAPDVTGGLIMVGGEDNVALVREILRLRAETVDEQPELCELADVDADNDGLGGCADPDCGSRCWPMCPLGESCTGPHCGDGACSVVEDYLICPADCQAP